MHIFLKYLFFYPRYGTYGMCCKRINLKKIIFILIF